MVADRRAVSSPLKMTMQVELDAKADSGTVHVEIVATDTIPFTGLYIRFTVIEDDLTSGLKHYDQILRDYFPSTTGYSITIAEGDTLSFSEDFEIDPSWVLENCRVLVFVQNGKYVAQYKREVAQAIQGPLLAPVPDAVANLTVTLLESDLVLQWSPVSTDTSGNPVEVDYYQVYRDTLSFFEPGSDPFTSTTDTFYVDDSGVVGDTGTHYYYAVTAVAGSKESDFSGTVGEFDTGLTNEPPE